MTNQYLNVSKFWKTTNKNEQYAVIGTASEALRVISILLYPIIPRYSEIVMKYFKMDNKERSLERCKIENKKEVVLNYDQNIRNDLFIRRIKNR